MPFLPQSRCLHPPRSEHCRAELQMEKFPQREEVKRIPLETTIGKVWTEISNPMTWPHRACLWARPAAHPSRSQPQLNYPPPQNTAARGLSLLIFHQILSRQPNIDTQIERPRLRSGCSHSVTICKTLRGKLYKFSFSPFPSSHSYTNFLAVENMKLCM